MKQLFLCECFDKGSICPVCNGTGCLLCENVGVAFTPCSTCENQHIFGADVLPLIKTSELAEIQQDVYDIRDSYQALHSLVLAQQPQIDVISQHIEDAKVKTEKAEEELVQAEQYTIQYRKWAWRGMLVTGAVVSGLFIGPHIIIALF